MFVVFEGIDRSGKSSLINGLHMKLLEKNSIYECIRFPDRTTHTGKIINDFLFGFIDLSPNAAYDLFVQNIKESQEKIKKLLDSNHIVLCDRYILSNKAYVSDDKFINHNILSEFIKPDVTIYLDIDPVEASKRQNYGEEKNENIEYQTRVRNKYISLIKYDPSVKVVNANVGKEQLLNDVYHILFE